MWKILNIVLNLRPSRTMEPDNMQSMLALHRNMLEPVKNFVIKQPPRHPSVPSDLIADRPNQWQTSWISLSAC